MTSSSISTALHRNRWVHLVLGILVSTVCLWIATRELFHDPDAITKAKEAFTQAKYRTLLPIMLATATFYWLKALRWRLLLLPIGKFQTVRDLFPFVMIGFGLNNVLPVHMGEVVRVLLFARHAHVKRSAVATSVVLERTCDSITVLTLLTMGLIFVQGLNSRIRIRTMLVAACVGLLVVILLFYVFRTEKFVAIVKKLLSPFVPATWLSKVAGTLVAGTSGLSALKQPRLILGILAFSLGSWLINGIVIHMALWSFGLPNGLLVSCIVLGLTAVGAAMPAAPGYIGVIQMCFVTVLSLFTDDQTGILAASIYYHVIEYVMVTLMGLYYLNTTGATLSQVQSALDSEPQPIESALSSEPQPAEEAR